MLGQERVTKPVAVGGGEKQQPQPQPPSLSPQGGYYSNIKVRQRLEAFFKAKKQVAIKEVDIKVVFSVNPAKKIKKLLSETNVTQTSTHCLEETLSKLTSAEEAWSEFGMDVFQRTWVTSLEEFLRIVPKNSLLMRQLLSNEAIHMLETQCSSKGGNNNDNSQSDSKSKPYIPTTNFGDSFADIFSGKYQQVEQKMKSHIDSQYYNNACGSFIIPPYVLTDTDEVWTSTSPVVVEVPVLDYKLKLISFHVMREEQKTIKCFMTTTTPTIKDNIDDKFEKIVLEHRYKEVRYLHVDLSQCHVQITFPDLSCFLVHLQNPLANNNNNNNDKHFTSMNYIVATYLADYLGLSVFTRGWENTELTSSSSYSCT